MIGGQMKLDPKNRSPVHNACVTLIAHAHAILPEEVTDDQVKEFLEFLMKFYNYSYATNIRLLP
jgi:hypothetical protein